MNQLTISTKNGSLENAIVQGVQNANIMESTRAQYLRAYNNAALAGVDFSDTAAIRSYMNQASWTDASYLHTCIGWGLAEMETMLNENVTPDTLATTQAAKMRIEAMRKRIELPKKPERGETVGIWLTHKQTKQMATLISTDTLIGQRDKVALGLLLKAGLRRSEAVGLTCDNVQQRGERTVLHIKGKGEKFRLVPISADFANELGEWCKRVGGGRVLRSVTKGGALGESMSAHGLYKMVASYGRKINLPDLTPHDLRRTYARLGYEGGVDLVQIMYLLGHASVETTIIYIGAKIDFNVTVSDLISF